MCATRSSSLARANSRKNRTLENEYFYQETQFAVVDVTSNVPNDPPTITNLVPLTIFEDQGEDINIFYSHLV